MLVTRYAVGLLYFKKESHAEARKPHGAANVLFGPGRRAPNSHSSSSSASELETYRRKQNLTQNGHSGSFNVTCFTVSGKVIRD